MREKSTVTQAFSDGAFHFRLRRKKAYQEIRQVFSLSATAKRYRDRNILFPTLKPLESLRKAHARARFASFPFLLSDDEYFFLSGFPIFCPPIYLPHIGFPCEGVRAYRSYTPIAYLKISCRCYRRAIRHC